MMTSYYDRTNKTTLHYRDVGKETTIITLHDLTSDEITELSSLGGKIKMNHSCLIKKRINELPNPSTLITQYVKEQDIVIVISNGEVLAILENKRNHQMKLDEKDVVRINLTTFAYNGMYYTGDYIPYDVPREVYYLPAPQWSKDVLMVKIDGVELRMSKHRIVGNKGSPVQILILEKLMTEFSVDMPNSAHLTGNALVDFHHSETLFLQDVIKLGLFTNTYFAQDCYYHMIKLGKTHLSNMLAGFTFNK